MTTLHAPPQPVSAAAAHASFVLTDDAIQRRFRAQLRLCVGAMSVSLLLAVSLIAAILFGPAVPASWSLLMVFTLALSAGLFIVALLGAVTPLLQLAAHWRAKSIRDSIERFELQQEVDRLGVALRLRASDTTATASDDEAEFAPGDAFVVRDLNPSDQLALPFRIETIEVEVDGSSIHLDPSGSLTIDPATLAAAASRKKTAT